MAKLMLVEDDNNLREIYGARLQAEGYQIVSAKDGEEALVLAKAEKPDLIISDIMMPKISGFEMLDILRNTDELKAVKVIMLTALGQSDDQQRANSLGADRYLVKSQVTLEDIVKVTHELLNDTPAAAAEAGPPPAVQPAASPASPPLTPAAPPSPPAPLTAAPAAVADAPPETPAPALATPAPAPELPTPTPAAPAPPTAAPAPPTPTVSIPVASEPPASDEPDKDSPAPAAGEPTALPTPADGDVPEPETQAEPKPEPETDSASAAVSDSSAQSTAQEEAGVESRIEDFVAGASEEATPPSAATATQPEDNTTAEAETAPSEPSAADTASDDKLVVDAAQALIDSTEADKTDASANVIEPTETPKPAASAPAKSSTVTIAHKKVISPLNDQPKQDLDALLAIEAAKEAKGKEQAGMPEPMSIVVNGESDQPPDPKVIATPSLTPPAPPTGSTITPTEEATEPAASSVLPNNPADPGSIAL